MIVLIDHLCPPGCFKCLIARSNVTLKNIGAHLRAVNSAGKRKLYRCEQKKTFGFWSEHRPVLVFFTRQPWKEIHHFFQHQIYDNITVSTNRPIFSAWTTSRWSCLAKLHWEAIKWIKHVFRIRNLFLFHYVDIQRHRNSWDMMSDDDSPTS